MPPKHRKCPNNSTETTHRVGSIPPLLMSLCAKISATTFWRPIMFPYVRREEFLVKDFVKKCPCVAMTSMLVTYHSRISYMDRFAIIWPMPILPVPDVVNVRYHNGSSKVMWREIKFVSTQRYIAYDAAIT